MKISFAFGDESAFFGILIFCVNDFGESIPFDYINGIITYIKNY